MTKKNGQSHTTRPDFCSNHIFFDRFTDRIGVGCDTYYKFNVFFLGKGLEPIEKFAEHNGILIADDLIEIIDKNMGYVIVAGMKAADKALYEFI